MYPLWTNYLLTLTLFSPFGCSTLTTFYPLWTNYHPPTSTSLYPLRQLNSFSLYPLWTNYTLTLTPLYPPLQPKPYINLIQFLLRCIPFEQINPSPLHHFPLLAAQLLHHLPLWKNTPGSSTFNSLCPLWTNYLLTLTLFSPFGCSTLTTFYHLWTNYHPPTSTPLYPLRQLNSFSMYPLWTNYTLTLTPLYPPLQPKPYINLIQFLLHCIPSEQINPSPLHHFPLLAAQLLHHLPLWKNTPGSSTFNSLCPLWTNYHLALTPFFHLWQLNSYFILPPLNKLPPPNLNTTLSP